MSVYLDVCCLNRPFDDQTQDRIRLEPEAVLLILKHCIKEELQWVSSEAVDLEVSQTPDSERRHRVQVLVSYALESVRAEPTHYETGQGNYTEARHQWLDGLSLQEIVQPIQQRRTA